MITYDMSKATGPLYIYLYQCLKEDISSGKLKPMEKMPSKRNLARNLGVSTITIENAYSQLVSEGYIRPLPRKGYFIADIADMADVAGRARAGRASGGKTARSSEGAKASLRIPKAREGLYTLSSNKPEISSFPFSVWSKLMRETLSGRTSALLDSSWITGVRELREAIAAHLASYRGMAVDPDQIVVGAGTEYLYSLIINLLGRDKIYCMENPGYRKIQQIYEGNNVRCEFARLDQDGILVEEVRRTGAEIVHTSPNHHFPTGITMPVSRRYELLAWANEAGSRYIIEDDYDSEFRQNGPPISTFYNIDAYEKVIYINSFSKSLASTMRISYMVLPEHLMNRYYDKLSFYSCTVPTFEQYTLAAFIARGYFEKHINRMRVYYGRKRRKVIEMVRAYLPKGAYHLVENDSGLHFHIIFHTEMKDGDIRDALMEEGVEILPVSDCYFETRPQDLHTFLLNYSCVSLESLPEVLRKLCGVIGFG